MLSVLKRTKKVSLQVLRETVHFFVQQNSTYALQEYQSIVQMKGWRVYEIWGDTFNTLNYRDGKISMNQF